MMQSPNPSMLASLQAVPWACWVVVLMARPTWLSGFAPYESALVPLLSSAVGWVFLAMHYGSSPKRVTAGIALGLLSSAIWFLAYVLGGVSLALGAVMGPLFVLALGIVPIIVWLVFGGSIALCRFALQALSTTTAR